MLPTMLDVAGLDVPPILHGQSLRAIVEDGTPGAAGKGRPIPIEFTRFSINHDGWGGYQPIRCVVVDNWKLVINLQDMDELYDLETDPAELVNLIDKPECSRVRDRLHDALLDELDRVRDPFRGPAWERRAWRRDGRRKWGGGYRHRPNDGYMPVTYAYQTGRPPEKWVEP
jgi:uncharacterized sulfatase